jgi:hypothetical protein
VVLLHRPRTWSALHQDTHLLLKAVDDAPNCSAHWLKTCISRLRTFLKIWGLLQIRWDSKASRVTGLNAGRVRVRLLVQVRAKRRQEWRQKWRAMLGPLSSND